MDANPNANSLAEANQSSASVVDTGIELANTVFAIVKEVGEMLNSIPYVKSLSGVILQIIQIRDEIKTNKERCRNIIDKVLRMSKSIYETLAEVAMSNHREKLSRLEDQLKEHARILTELHIVLQSHRSRRMLSKFLNRGLDKLNQLDRRLDELNTQLIMNIIVDIRMEQAASALTAKVIEIDHVLPPKPDLMVQRQDQVDTMLHILLGIEPSRIAILGGGGFGKTTLARSVLHYPKVTERYKSRYFLSCEGMADVDALLLGFGSMLGIQTTPSGVLAAARSVLAISTTLLCLDNFETPWEPSGTRAKIEDVLASIAAIPNLSLIITMRGTQRPSKVAWSHPLLPPLSTLSSDSAHVILQTICPNHIIDEYSQNLLDSIEGIPLAITLISNLLRDGVSSQTLWTRWSKEQTGLVENGGNDRESNLNASIALSLRSPRITKDAGAMNLLAALSLLPYGFPLAEIEQLEAYLGIHDVHKHLQTLRAISLINADDALLSPRIQTLSPIRLFCLEFLLPDISLLLEKIVDYYISVMLDAKSKQDNSTIYNRVVPEIQNIHSVFQRVYKVGYSQDISSLIDATTILTDWSRYIGYLSKDTILTAFEKSNNLLILRAKCLLSLGKLYRTESLYTRAEKCFRDAAESFNRENDAENEARASMHLGDVLYLMQQLDQAEVILKASLELHTQANYKQGEADAGQTLGSVHLARGQYLDAEATLTIALESYKQIPDLLGQANTAESLAGLHITLGNLVDAEKFATESLAAAKQASYAVGEGNALHKLGVIYLRTDKVTNARQVFEQALAIAKQQNNIHNLLGIADDLAQVYIQSDQLSAAEALLVVFSRMELDIIWIPNILTTLARTYICGDRLDKAEPHLERALQLFQKFEDRPWQAEVLSHLGELYLKSDQLDDAERVLKSVSDLGAWGDVEMHRRWVLGDLCILKGELEDAETSFNSAIVRAKRFQSSYQQGNIIRSMGILHIKRGRIDRAIHTFEHAREFHRKAQWVSEQATDLRRLSEAYEMQGRSQEAKAAFEEAEALFESVREARTLKL